MGKLPEDLVFAEILPKLPSRSLMRFKCVSKKWYIRITTDLHFIGNHLDYQYSKTTKSCSVCFARQAEKNEYKLVLLLNESEVVDVDMSYITAALPTSPFNIDIAGSCNGLICTKEVLPNDITNIMLWNPATRESRYLPEPITNIPQHNVCVGFGFDDYSKDYKVVRIVKVDDDIEGKSLHVKVFTKSSDSWRKLKDSPGSGIVKANKYGVAVNGALCWPGFHKDQLNQLPSRVLSFNLRDDELQVIDIVPFDIFHAY